MNNLRWRILLIVVIIGACLWAIIPPGQKIRLGLDLKGGVHLVLRVNTDDALKLETETTAERLREDLEKAGVTGATVRTLGPRAFEVIGVQPAQDALLRSSAAGVEASFNRESGASGAYRFMMKPNVAIDLARAAVDQAQQTIERRVNDLGVAEALIARQGTNDDQLLVQLPGVTDVARAKGVIQSMALLELKLVEQGSAPSREALLQATGGQEPAGTEVLPGIEGRSPAATRPSIPGSTSVPAGSWPPVACRSASREGADPCSTSFSSRSAMDWMTPLARATSVTPGNWTSNWSSLVPCRAINASATPRSFTRRSIVCCAWSTAARARSIATLGF